MMAGGLVLVGAAAVASVNFGNTSVHCEALPVWGKPGTSQERTFLAVKPDGVQRGLVGDIIARFEKVGLLACANIYACKFGFFWAQP